MEACKAESDRLRETGGERVKNKQKVGKKRKS